MKQLKYILLLAGAALAAACSEPKMNTYEGRNDEVVFGASKYSLRTTEAESDSYTIYVTRTATSGAVSKPLTATFQDPAKADAFSFPTTVDFADGESVFPLTITVDCMKLTKGKAETITFELDSEASINAYTACTFSVTADYTFIPYGTAIYYSASMSDTFGQDLFYPQPVLVAEQDPTVFRLPDLYDNLGTQYSEPGYNLDFKWDGGSRIEFFEEADANGLVMIASGFNYPGYGMVYLNIDTDPDYTGYDADEDIFILNYRALVPVSGGWGLLLDWDYDYFYMIEYAE